MNVARRGFGVALGVANDILEGEVVTASRNLVPGEGVPLRIYNRHGSHDQKFNGLIVREEKFN